MEPWQEEDLRQLRLAARRVRLPRCVCCDEHLPTERFLPLADFGFFGVVCENCVRDHWEYTPDLLIGN